MKTADQTPPEASDEELARQTQAGSLAAFEQLVERYERRVHAFVFQFCRHATDASEITQDTFVKAFQRLAQFDAKRDFAAWLFTIARRQCIDRYRSAPPEADGVAPDGVDEADPAELAARREEGSQLWRIARKQLGENQFQAVWLFYAEDMEVAGIAQVMGKSRVHVNVLLFRARQVLGRHLESRQAMAAPVSGNRTSLSKTALARQASKLSTAK